MLGKQGLRLLGVSTVCQVEELTWLKVTQNRGEKEWRRKYLARWTSWSGLFSSFSSGLGNHIVLVLLLATAQFCRLQEVKGRRHAGQFGLVNMSLSPYLALASSQCLCDLVHFADNPLCLSSSILLQGLVGLLSWTKYTVGAPQQGRCETIPFGGQNWEWLLSSHVCTVVALPFLPL